MADAESARKGWTVDADDDQHALQHVAGLFHHGAFGSAGAACARTCGRGRRRELDLLGQRAHAVHVISTPMQSMMKAESRITTMSRVCPSQLRHVQRVQARLTLWCGPWQSRVELWQALEAWFSFVHLRSRNPTRMHWGGNRCVRSVNS